MLSTIEKSQTFTRKTTIQLRNTNVCLLTISNSHKRKHTLFLCFVCPLACTTKYITCPSCLSVQGHDHRFAPKHSLRANEEMSATLLFVCVCVLRWSVRYQHTQKRHQQHMLTSKRSRTVQHSGHGITSLPSPARNNLQQRKRRRNLNFFRPPFRRLRAGHKTDRFWARGIGWIWKYLYTETASPLPFVGAG